MEAGDTVTLGYSTLDVLKWIVDYFDKNQATPTYREIMRGMGYASTAVIAYHVKRLTQAGYVRKHGGYGLAILKRPE